MGCWLRSQQTLVAYKEEWGDKLLSRVMAWFLVHWTPSHWAQVRCPGQKLVSSFTWVNKKLYLVLYVTNPVATLCHVYIRPEKCILFWSMTARGILHWTVSRGKESRLRGWISPLKQGRHSWQKQLENQHASFQHHENFNAIKFRNALALRTHATGYLHALCIS